MSLAEDYLDEHYLLSTPFRNLSSENSPNKSLSTTKDQNVRPRLKITTKFSLPKIKEQIFNNYKDISNEELNKKYEDINNRVQKDKCLIKKVCTSKEFEGGKQWRSIENNKKYQKQWNKCLNNLCKSIGRSLTDSVMVKPILSRVEKARLVATPTAHIYAEKKWHLDLRKTSKSKDVHHYSVPIGNSYGRLWMRITEDPDKEKQMLRCDESPSFKSKKRITELEPVKNWQKVIELIAIGKNAYKIEVDGFRDCSKEKVILNGVES